MLCKLGRAGWAVWEIHLSPLIFASRYPVAHLVSGSSTDPRKKTQQQKNPHCSSLSKKKQTVAKVYNVNIMGNSVFMNITEERC